MNAMITTKEEKQIYQFVTELGGITTLQAKALINRDMAATTFFLQRLVRMNVLAETYYNSGRFIKRGAKLSYNKDNELCGWVMLKSRTDKTTDTKEYFKGEHPVDIFFRSNQTLFMVMFYDEDCDVAAARLMEQYYKTKGLQESSRVIFVVNSQNARHILETTTFTIPFNIAYVKESKNPTQDEPNIEMEAIDYSIEEEAE